MNEQHVRFETPEEVGHTAGRTVSVETANFPVRMGARSDIKQTGAYGQNKIVDEQSHRGVNEG